MRYPNRHSVLILFFPLLISLILSGCGKWPRFIILNDPLSAEEHLKLGSIYESKGEIELAIKEYKSALKIDKYNDKTLFFLGNAYFGMDNLKRAEAFYKRALKVGTDKRKGLIYNNLAWVYIEDGRNLDEAVRLSKEAVKLDPENSSIYLDTLGVAYKTRGDLELAEKALLESIDKASTQDPSFRSEVLTHLSEVYKAMGKDIEDYRGIKEK